MDDDKQRNDVLTKTAKDTGVSERTVATARQYNELIKKSPELIWRVMFNEWTKLKLQKEEELKKKTTRSTGEQVARPQGGGSQPEPGSLRNIIISKKTIKPRFLI